MDVSVAATRVVALEVYAASAQESLSQIRWLKNFNSGNNRVQGRSTRNTGFVQLNNCAITKHIYIRERSAGAPGTRHLCNYVEHMFCVLVDMQKMDMECYLVFLSVF